MVTELYVIVIFSGDSVSAMNIFARLCNRSNRYGHKQIRV